MDNRSAEILKRFNESWDQTETLYDELIENYPGFDRLKPLRIFLSKIRSEGYSNFFRAGTSMHTLLLSRSVDFGLRTDQKYIKIEAIDANDFEITLRDGEKIYRQYRIDNLYDDKLAKLLKTLEGTLVD